MARNQMDTASFQALLRATTLHASNMGIRSPSMLDYGHVPGDADMKAMREHAQRVMNGQTKEPTFNMGGEMDRAPITLPEVFPDGFQKAVRGSVGQHIKGFFAFISNRR